MRTSASGPEVHLTTGSKRTRRQCRRRPSRQKSAHCPAASGLRDPCLRRRLGSAEGRGENRALRSTEEKKQQRPRLRQLLPPRFEAQPASSAVIPSVINAPQAVGSTAKRNY